MLGIILLSSMKYLTRQGLPIQGGDEAESNLIQLLCLRAEDNPELAKGWIGVLRNTYHMKIQMKCWRLWHNIL